MRSIDQLHLTFSAIPLILGLAACVGKPAAVQVASAPAPVMTPATTAPTPSITTDSTRSRYASTAADVRFMSSMIGHHSQAVTMSKMAPGHGANARVQALAERIINAQQDEIASMQQWLRDRNQPVPAAATGQSMMNMSGMQHDMLMPGMLTDAQMNQLDNARGPAFDRLFLEYMIRHHRGAVSMVDTLFGTEGAAQDETVFKLANDVSVDQTTEIERMQRMLESFR